jgi:hypothetical protein
LNDDIKKARDDMEAARKKLTGGGKGKQGNAGGENDYYRAALALSRVDPTFVMPRRRKHGAGR